jgi:glycosyltransferase involved in cell wall biosynthesis
VTGSPVSIGLPVYDGAAFIEEALDSILGQSFGDFELIISDNASTDRTEAICRDYANRDPRIRYHRNAENRGAAWNYNRVFELSSGRYFKWLAHDDVCGKDFLLRCVEALDADPSITLVYPRAEKIDARGALIRRPLWDLHSDSERPHERFRYQICIDHWCYHVFGLIRAETLRQTRLIDRYSASDRVLLAHLSLLGRFHEIPEVLAFQREHSQRSTRANATLRSRSGWFEPKAAEQITFPNWRLLREYLLVIERTPLPSRDRQLCRFQLLRWIRHHWRGMAAELPLATNARITRRKG